MRLNVNVCKGVFRAKAKEDCEMFFKKLADEVEEGLSRNDLWLACGVVCRIKGSSVTHTIPVRK